VRHSTQDTVEIIATARSFDRGRTEVEQDTALPGVGQAEFRQPRATDGWPKAPSGMYTLYLYRCSCPFGCARAI